MILPLFIGMSDSQAMIIKESNLSSVIVLLSLFFIMESFETLLSVFTLAIGKVTPIFSAIYRVGNTVDEPLTSNICKTVTLLVPFTVNVFSF
jgi:hypothetical protein